MWERSRRWRGSPFHRLQISTTRARLQSGDLSASTHSLTPSLSHTHTHSFSQTCGSALQVSQCSTEFGSAAKPAPWPGPSPLLKLETPHSVSTLHFICFCFCFSSSSEHPLQVIDPFVMSQWALLPAPGQLSTPPVRPH